MEIISYLEVRETLISTYSRYLEDKEDTENLKRAFSRYLHWFSGTDMIFNDATSNAIGALFNLSEKTLTQEEAKEILDKLKKAKV